MIALGGNAILRSKELSSYDDQFENVRRTARHVVDLTRGGAEVVLTHGNGPQVGNLLIQNEAAADLVPAVPLDVCGAETQGQIGYMLAQALRNELRAAGIYRPVATVVTQTLVDADDPAFAEPTKPVGPFLPRETAEARMRDKGETWAEVDARGWRKLVPSPQPKGIVEIDAISILVDRGAIVVAGGGGGVPVLRRPDGRLAGVDAVVDKDAAASRLALELRADVLLILTDVPGVAIDYGTPEQRFLGRVSLEELQDHLVHEPFSAGSIGPKVRAAYRFVRDGGRQATICALEDVDAGLRGEAGTTVAGTPASSASPAQRPG